ncbi:energy-coupling factor transporter transmembrane protein EcfT [Pelotomaculum terephthalicicum JT]|uniref:energy-coupling factor transporter transmembrane component T family protein n=1 Tax=Pelotomaculum TaxID=191373 RepID=UPI0009CCEB36|nr:MULTISPECIES: energy-coupling factor transporter transmembrane component T [Pelotomaculum]MCG9967253.1 energy-coupling factor transporter transmembrane protein EcfT [Pelotomaculum terephthalicicum JT]OPX88645.1 MAG: Energy-coupling factor transporter transmembrane protein EcfT [Pelotomaculum sp. PtaB.Bin117]OPY63579.1 MAG: Energy-coupling factor transporter transmembrane protein EcfT [Pelotomaculum sp. PtaU1.Bin065]
MKLDPRTKMVMVVCLSGLALLYNTPGQLLLVFAVTVALLMIFHFELSVIGDYLKPFLSLMLFLLVIQCVFSPGGEVLLAAGPVPLITTGGLSMGVCVVLRIMTVAAAAMLFTTFSSRDFILGLVQWKVPYELAFMVSIALRFLPVFRDELSNVVTAVQLRGVELKKVPWREKMALYRRLFFPVVYGTMLKAQQLAVSMEARGFRVYPRRTYLRRLNLLGADIAVMLVCLVSTIMLIALHFT